MLTDWHKSMIIGGAIIALWGSIAAVASYYILDATHDTLVIEERLSYLDGELMRAEFCQERDGD